MNTIRKAKIHSIGKVSHVLLYVLKPTSLILYAFAILMLLAFCVLPSGAISIPELIASAIAGDEFFDLIKVKGLLLSTRFFAWH